MTLYDSQVFLFANPFDRYLINDRTDLHYNADGSLDMYIQAEQPSDPKQAQNWVPSPPGRGLPGDLAASTRPAQGASGNPRWHRLAAAGDHALRRRRGRLPDGTRRALP